MDGGSALLLGDLRRVPGWKAVWDSHLSEPGYLLGSSWEWVNELEASPILALQAGTIVRSFVGGEKCQGSPSKLVLFSWKWEALKEPPSPPQGLFLALSITSSWQPQ